MPKIGRITAKADSKFPACVLPYEGRCTQRGYKMKLRNWWSYLLGFRNGSTRITHGQWPKEHDRQLKRIEKLAQCLPSKVAPLACPRLPGLDT